MEKLAVFLRGVNVKGTRMKMDELKKALESQGYKDVNTILASGNVVLSTDEDDIDQKDRIQKAVGSYFEYEANVVLKTQEQVENIIAESKKHTIPDGYHHYILLSDDDGLAHELQSEFKKCKTAQHEKLIIDTYGIYWIVPKGNTLKSDFGSVILGKKAFKSKLTSRTIATIEKVYNAMI
ncbi:MAG: DUF1697 domain-containing protein [Eubacteriales bacterium]